MNNWEIYTYLKAKRGGSGGQSVTNPALRLIDWEGTALKEYTAEQVANLTALPTPPSLRADVDRELLVFQGYNWSVSDIKSWVKTHEGKCLMVGAIYTTTDGQDYNYWNNPRLTTATTISKHKRGTTTIGDSAFRNCFSLTNITIPEGATTIGDSAFNGCRSLASINLPDSVTSIGGSAFYNCFSLTSINLPDSVTSIGGNAFYNCFSLTSINLPDSVTSIGGNAFYGCASLTDIVVKGTPSLANTTAISNIYEDYLIYVPRAKLSWYSTATNWTTLYNNNKIAAIEDNIEYLESIGIDV